MPNEKKERNATKEIYSLFGNCVKILRICLKLN